MKTTNQFFHTLMKIILMTFLVSSFAQAKNNNPLKQQVLEEGFYNRITAILHSATSTENQLAQLQDLEKAYNQKLDRSNCQKNICRKYTLIELQALNDKVDSTAKSSEAFYDLIQSIKEEKRYALNLRDEMALFAAIDRQSLPQSMGEYIQNWEQEILTKLDQAFQNDYNSREINVMAGTLALRKKTNPQWQAILKRLQIQSDLNLAHLLGKDPKKATDNSQLAADLINQNVELDKYRAGRYANYPRLYMFCRSDRQFPCMLAIRNREGKLHTKADGTLFTQPSLGYSRHLKDYNEPSGNTPSGVFQIDSVMPEADQTLVFGKYHRLVLNLIPESTDEVNFKYLLPASSYASNWWRESVVARDMGRGLFRIHGTGLRSSSGRPYFPLVPTSGCVAQRENKYNNVNYIDQRHILDELMRATGIEPLEENEYKIRGLLYVINVDDKKAPMTVEDLKKLKILP